VNPPATYSRVSFHQGVLRLLVALLAFSAPVYSKAVDRVSGVTAKPAHPGEALIVQAQLVDAAVMERVELAYRSFGQRDYRKMEMMVVDNTASATIPAPDVVAPFVEYYVIIYVRNSTEVETYPPVNPETQPLKTEVIEGNPANNFITIISPDENEQLESDDVLISFTVLTDSTVDSAATRLRVDGKDITDEAVRSGNLMIVHPENANLLLSSGTHSIAVEVHGKDGKELARTTWSFGVRGGIPADGGISGGWRYTSSIQLETRSENIGNTSTPYNRATLAAGGTYGDYRVNGKIYVTNEEREFRQPQNRFFLGAESPWLKLGAGDSYPTFPDLIMTGKRVRGFTANLSLGPFALDIATGQILRHVEGDTLKTFPHDSLNAEQNTDPFGTYVAYDTAASDVWAKIRGGTFARDLLVVHPRFGKKESSFLGFTFLKSKDDRSSLHYGVRPQENLVVGSDFVLTFIRRAIEISGQAALSATNKDITRDTFSDADIDSAFQNYSESNRNNIKRVRDILSRFITVNENLIPLAAKNLPTLAYEGSLAVNAFDNTLRFTYLRHGNSFESFGQSFVRPDVVGYNLSDRVRLVRNILFLSGGFERLQDNTAETKLATTTSTTASAGVSYFPHTDFPNITLGYSRLANKNDYPVDSLRTDDHTDRILAQISRPFIYHGRHQATASISTSSRNDQTPRNFDVHSTSVILGVTSTFEIPLQTVVSVSSNWNSFFTFDPVTHNAEVSRDYTMIYLRGEYRLADDRLRLSGTVSPMIGDASLRRTLLGGGAQYFFTTKVSALTDVNCYLNGNRDNDLIGSVILRVDM